MGHRWELKPSVLNRKQFQEAFAFFPRQYRTQYTQIVVGQTIAVVDVWHDGSLSAKGDTVKRTHQNRTCAWFRRCPGATMDNGSTQHQPKPTRRASSGAPCKLPAEKQHRSTSFLAQFIVCTVRRNQARSLRGVLCGIVGHGHAARDGAAYPGEEDCHDRSDRVEEGSVLRRPTSETTNSLSVSDRVRSIPGIFSGGGRGVLETLWFESESQPISSLLKNLVFEVFSFSVFSFC